MMAIGKRDSFMRTFSTVYIEWGHFGSVFVFTRGSPVTYRRRL